MRQFKQFFPLLFLLLSSYVFAQTPEEEKMMKKAEHMRDSIMNTPEVKAIMKQVEDMERNQESNKKTSNVAKSKKSKDKYWENTLVSNNNKQLQNWTRGVADLVFNYSYDSSNDRIKYVKVGIIKADGSIELNPTSKIPVLEPLNNFKNSNAFYDIHNPAVYQYSNEDASFKLNSYLLVYQNEQKIGTLTLGNSLKVTRNLLISGDLYFGDEGYLLSWVYVDEDCAISAKENWKGDLSNTGTPLIVETDVEYDLSFKTGWNLVKTEVIGTYNFPNAPEEDRSRYKKHEHTTIVSIPNDAKYFFRPAP